MGTNEGIKPPTLITTHALHEEWRTICSNKFIGAPTGLITLQVDIGIEIETNENLTSHNT